MFSPCGICSSPVTTMSTMKTSPNCPGYCPGRGMPCCASSFPIGFQVEVYDDDEEGPRVTFFSGAYPAVGASERDV